MLPEMRAYSASRARLHPVRTGTATGMAMADFTTEDTESTENDNGDFGEQSRLGVSVHLMCAVLRVLRDLCGERCSPDQQAPSFDRPIGLGSWAGMHVPRNVAP